MPFVKRGAAAPAREHTSRTTAWRRMSPRCAAPMPRRAGAPRARSAATREAVPALAAALGAEQVPRVREAIMTALMRIGDEASVLALLPYLRSQDAGQRAAAIEALQALPEAILPFMTALLARQRFRRSHPRHRTRPQHAGPDATRLLCAPARTRAASQCLRRGGRCAGRSRHARRTAGAASLRRAFCRTRPFLPFAVATAIARISGTEG